MFADDFRPDEQPLTADENGTFSEMVAPLMTDAWRHTMSEYLRLTTEPMYYPEGYDVWTGRYLS